MKKFLELGGKREVKCGEISGLLGPKRVDPTVFLLGEEGPLNITT